MKPSSEEVGWVQRLPVLLVALIVVRLEHYGGTREADWAILVEMRGTMARQMAMDPRCTPRC